MTDSWYRLDLGNGMVAHPKTNEVQQAFTAYYLVSGMTPTGALLFSRYDLEKDNIELFFNPKAKHIALRFGAIACEKPTSNRYRLNVRSSDIADALAANFPDQGPP